MVEYTPEMFDKAKIRDYNPEIFMRKETLEFQLRIYQDKFDSFKRLGYKDLLIYERKKVYNPNLLPDAKVLSQLKIIETDQAVVEFTQTITSLKRELTNTNTTINNLSKKIDVLFSFTDLNMRKYLSNLIWYFDGTLLFEDLMREIFRNEFNNEEMYVGVATLRNYAILSMMVDKMPSEWQRIGRVLYDESKYNYTIEDLESTSSEEVDLFKENQKKRRDARVELVRKKIIEIDEGIKATKKERSALDMSLLNVSRNIATDVVMSRGGRHNEIMDTIEKKSMGQNKTSGGVSFASQQIRDPKNSPSQAHGNWGEPWSLPKFGI